MNTIKFSSAVSVDKGLIRSNNEDNFYFNGRILTADDRDVSNTFSSTPSDELQIYGVFDGMGGEAQGEVASFIAAQTMEKSHKRILSGNLDVKNTILKTVEDINTKICKKIIESGEKRIGATFSAIVIDNNAATVFNVGDSRVYMLRNGEMKQVSVDDTTAQRLVNLGMITEEAAKTHKDRHKLTQHLGIFRDEMIIEPHVSRKIEIQKGDKFLLCSDGLTDMLEDEEIKEILSENKSCDQLSKKLIDAALANGGNDNVTAIVICADSGAASSNKKKFIIPALAVLVCAVIAGIMFAPKSEKKEPVAEVENIQVTKLYFSNPVSEIAVGTENVLMVGFEPAGAKPEIIYSSSDASIFEIDAETGYYKALNPGKVTIKATADGIENQLDIEIYVPVTDISGIPEKLSLEAGKSVKLAYNIVPSGITEQVNFISENSDIVTVTADGTIKAVAAGKANVVVSVRGFSKTIAVSVTKKTETIKPQKPEPKPVVDKPEDVKPSGEQSTETPQAPPEKNEPAPDDNTVANPDPPEGLTNSQQSPQGL